MVVRSGRKSKPSEEYDEPSETDLYNRMMKIPNQKHRSYAAFMYLMGNRVSEGIPGTSEFTEQKTKVKHTRQYSGIRKKDIRVDGSWLEVDRLPTLKRKVKDSTKFYREGIVYIDGSGEMPFIAILMDYIHELDDETLLWDVPRRTMHYVCDKYLGIPPKMLRNMRAKKDARKYGLGAIELKEKYNWGNNDMPFYYARFNKQAIKEKIKGGARIT